MSEIEEHVGVGESVLDQAAAIWHRLAPEPVEACAIASADHATYAPMALSDHRAALEAGGFPERLHERAFQALRVLGLLRREPSPALGTLSPRCRGRSRTVLESGRPARRRRPADSRRTARRSARRHPSDLGTLERGFAFPPGLEHQIAGGLTDATHERKLFVAHILNGHLYGARGTGRIVHPLPFVDALIDEGAVGPTTAARHDYGLLEAAGIVRAEEVEGGQAILHLIKADVAEGSRELLRLALREDDDSEVSSVDALWIPGSALSTPEGDRHRLAPPEPAEKEVIHSTVMELRGEIARRVRGEEP